jgi:ferrous iron transport protein A
MTYIFSCGQPLFQNHPKFAAHQYGTSTLKLSELKYGQIAQVTEVRGEELAIKLFEMGLLPGEEVQLENIAPFGDPIAIRVGEYKMCLRVADAHHIDVNLKQH